MTKVPEALRARARVSASSGKSRLTTRADLSPPSAEPREAEIKMCAWCARFVDMTNVGSSLHWDFE